MHAPLTQVQNVSAIVIRSPDPAGLAGFYREHLGIDFAVHDHGPMRDHWETQLGDVHMAVLRGAAGSDAPSVRSGPSVTFRVESVEANCGALERAGLVKLHPIVDLGEGKRVVSFRDPDGNAFQLIEIDVSLER